MSHREAVEEPARSDPRAGERRSQAFSPSDTAVLRGGAPLDTTTRTWFEQRLGHDFGQVRIRHDDASRAYARGLGDHALTSGSDIIVGREDFMPQSATGRSLLAHELTHVVQQDRSRVGPTVSVDQAEADAEATAERVSAGHAFAVTARAPAGVPLLQSAPSVDERTRLRGTIRTSLSPDPGRVVGRQTPEQGLEPSGPTDRSATEAKLQSEVAFLRPLIPVWTDRAGMTTFDSVFFRDAGPFDFRGRQMAGWDINYYFVSMAMAHQGWDWNEAQAIIWLWNSRQAIPGVPGDPDMTSDMWFAAQEGFRDEQERMAQEASGQPSSTAPPAGSAPSP